MRQKKDILDVEEVFPAFVEKQMEEFEESLDNFGKKYKVVKCKKLNLREKPLIFSDIICELPEGEELVVQGFVEEWAHVYTSAGLEGYVMSTFIEEV